MPSPSGPVLGESRATIVYRPVRRMYSIPSGDRDLLREVVRHASKHWGGILDLIAVEETPGLWTGFDRFCAGAGDPDRVIVVGRDDVDEMARYEALVPTTDQELVTFRSHLYPADAGVQASTEVWQPLTADPKASLFAAMSWGEPSASLLDLDYELARDAPVPTNPSGEEWAMPPERIVEQAVLGTTTLEQSARGLLVRTGSGVQQYPFVFIGIASADDLDALTYFWNIRALLAPYRIRVVALPLWARPDDLSKVRQDIMAMLGLTTNSEPDVGLCIVRGEDAAAAARLMQDGLGFVRYMGDKLSTFYPARTREGAPTYALTRPSLPASVLIQAASSAEYPVLAGSELGLLITRPEGIPEGVVEVIGVPELTLPRRRNIASRVVDGTRLTASGAAWMGLGNGEFRAKVLPDREVVTALLGYHGIAATPSDWGAAADRTLVLLGGVEGVEPLASDGALHVIDLLAERGPYQRTGSGRPRPEPLEALTLATVASRLAPNTPFGTKSAAAPIIDALVRAGIVFPGVRIVCVRCEADEWRAIDDVRSEMVCARCRAAIRFSALPPGRLPEESAWEYRLNAVLVWPLDQGVIPGLLAMRRIRRDAAVRARLFFGQTLTGPGVSGEIDIVGALDRDPVAAEVKLGPIMTAEEIDRTMVAAERMRGIAYFATAATTWDPATTSLLAQAIAARPGVRVRQLLRQDLTS